MMDGIARAAIIIAALSGVFALGCIMGVVHNLVSKVDKIEKAVKELNPGVDL